MPHRFILTPYHGTSTRHTCPSCGRRREFTRYIDTETNTELAPHAGKCNRAVNCGYHYTPKQYFEENKIDTPLYNRQPLVRQTHQDRIVPPASYIDTGIFKQSLQGYDTNHFTQYLSALFGADEAAQLISRYYIGTSAHWRGATVFWQLDIAHEIRGGKIMLYDPQTGKRVKKPYNHITWVHSALKLKDYHLQQCLFGEHLLRGNNKPAAIVESEKTAIIASRYMPQYIWLAAGSLTNLTHDKCKVLKGRKVILYPDLNAHELWSKKAAELRHITFVTVAEVLEQIATEADHTHGLDIADYLISLPLPPANQHLVTAYAAELRLMSERYLCGGMSKSGYLLFTKEIERRILAANIPLVAIVRAT